MVEEMSEVEHLIQKIEATYMAVKKRLAGKSVQGIHEYIMEHYTQANVYWNELVNYVGEEQASKIVKEKQLEIFTKQNPKTER